MTGAQTREAWLNDAVDILCLHLDRFDIGTRPTAIRVSCGFPGGGSARTTIGECWDPIASADGSVEIYISPTIADAARVLDILLHELIHAYVGCHNGHRGPFVRLARRCGLAGKPTATTASPALQAALDDVVVPLLGPYPHAPIALGLGRPKQSTRMLKVSCDYCGYTLRSTAKWLAVAVPCCPDPDCDGSEVPMEVAW